MRLETRLTLYVALIVVVAMGLFLSIIYVEFARGRFSLDERSLVAQAEEWTELADRGVYSLEALEKMTPGSIDPPYTGLLVGKQPVLGIAIRREDGTTLLASDRFVPGAVLNQGFNSKDVLLFDGWDRHSGEELIVAQKYLPKSHLVMQISRPKTDSAAIANTFFLQALEELSWGPVAIIVIVYLATSLAIRISLRGVRDLIRSVNQIGLENVGSSYLDTELAPVEIKPIVYSFNNLLSRIDVGVASQRDFSNNAAHELRTPLTSVKLRVEALTNPAERDILLREVDGIARVIEQLLVLARLEGAQLDTPLAAVDLGEAVRQCCEEHAEMIIAGGRNLEFDPGAADGSPILADRRLIQIVVRNLLQNCNRHARSGATVRVSLPDPNTVFVEDDGPGVDPDLHDLMFERFWKADRSTRGNSGLGLSICRIAMALMGGTIAVDRSYSTGLRIRLDFRLRPIGAEGDPA